jgi:hypothetical protein
MVGKRISNQMARTGDLERELAMVSARMDAAYTDKFEGKISEEFWQRKQAEMGGREELRIKSVIAGLGENKDGDRLLSIRRILELAQNAHYLYLPRQPAEQAELLKK